MTDRSEPGASLRIEYRNEVIDIPIFSLTNRYLCMLAFACHMLILTTLTPNEHNSFFKLSSMRSPVCILGKSVQLFYLIASILQSKLFHSSSVSAAC
jgi:hypothetical protein